MAARELDFDSVDEILQAHALGKRTFVDQRLASSHVERIGPLTEYSFQARASANGLPNLQDFPASSVVTALLTANQPNESSLKAKPVEFVLFPRGPNPFGAPRWIAFRMRFQSAAESAGFAKKMAQAITAAFGEMTDNVMRHSERPQSAVAGYRWIQGEFEYVVADAGIGILASLRSCPSYQQLRDDEEALNTALRPGESRYGKGSGHGTGFNQIFKSLVNLFGFLRFRTGSHSVKLNGQSPGLPSAQSAQCPPYFQGFLVSILCRANEKNLTPVCDSGKV